MKKLFEAKTCVGSEELDGSGKVFFLVHLRVAVKSVRQITDMLLEDGTLKHLTVVALESDFDVEEAANYAFTRVMTHMDSYVGTINHEGIMSAYRKARESWAWNYEEGSSCEVPMGLDMSVLFDEGSS